MLKDNKGISLTTMVVTVLIILIILSAITYSAFNSMKIRRLNKLYNDIRQLNDAVAVYYLKNGTLPVQSSAIYRFKVNETINEKIIKFVLKDGVTTLRNENDLLNPNDFGVINSNGDEGVLYYKLDTKLLKNLSLNYDKDGSFIINSNSHKIYYVEGVDVDGVLYHTLPLNYRKIPLKTTT